MSEVRWKNYTAYNFSHFFIYLPKVIKIYGNENLTMSWETIVLHSFFWDTVYIYLFIYLS